MKFPKVELDTLLEEIAELPADWMDDTARRLVASIGDALPKLESLKVPPGAQEFQRFLQEDPFFLDVCRLFLGLGQEPAAHRIREALGMGSASWSRLRAMAGKEPGRMADALVEIEAGPLIFESLKRKWTIKDVLTERLRLGRGRAIAGQRRGRSLEDEVQTVLQSLDVPFLRGVAFTGLKGKTAKCDFAIPKQLNPKIVIEVKGYEATGSKLTDFLGDVLKIIQAKKYHMYFFVVTDGRGWLNRQSDLRQLIEHQHEGLIDMIFTRRRLRDLGRTVNLILKQE